MPRLLAIEWNRREVRYVLANTRGENVDVAQAESIPLKHAADDEDSPEAQVAATLQSALAERKIGRATTLVAVGRGSVELWDFTLPPASDAELPELVANMAAHESPTMTDRCVLDFVVTSDSTAESRSVTAMVLSAEELARINDACEATGLTPHCIVPRSYSAASLFLRSTDRLQPDALLVNLVDDEVDLTVLANGRPVFSRTVRLPHQRTEPSAVEKLIAEIRRTLVVAPLGQSEGAGVETVYVFGRPGDHGPLIERIRDQLELPGEVFDVFGTVDAPREATSIDAGCFASLVGLLVEESHGGRHAIDFLHPKRPPKPPDRKRRLLFAGGALAAVFLMGGAYVWHTLATADEKIGELVGRLKELDGRVKQVEKKRKAYNAVQAWNAAQVVWLDELRDLSLRFPSDRDVILMDLTIGPSRSRGGTVKFRGLAREPTVVTRMEQGLRDQFHRIHTPRVEERIQDESYTWRFESTLAVAPRGKSEYVSHQAESRSKSPKTKKP